MKLFCIGLNWKTPVRVRERLAIEGENLAEAFQRLRALFSADEFTILSTCNRTEIYAAHREGNPGAEIHDLCEFLARFHDLPLTEFYDHLYLHEDTGAALHLFKVTSGLDSLILGEAQILGQVKAAYQAAVDHHAAGMAMHHLFQRALSIAKRVHTETDLGKGRLSIASAAVDYIRGVFDDFREKTVLVVGAGKMAELTLTHLRELHPGNVVICNRTPERAERLIAKFGGDYVPISDLRHALVQADIVISSTGAEEPIIREREFIDIMKERRHRLMAIVDIAVPRDFDVTIGDLDNVLLWNIDDLEKVRFSTLGSREKELDRALRIVDGEIEAFQAALALQQSGPVIGRLEREYDRIMQQELEWLLPQLNGIPEEQKEKVRHFAHRLKNKFLHPPKAALRAEARTGTPHGLIEAMRRLFGLQEDGM